MDLMDLINKKKQEINAANRPKTTKLPDGTSRWRILPSWRKDGDPTFWHDFGAHYVKGADKAIKAVYVCTEKTFGRPCSVCQSLSTAMHHATDDNTQNLLKEANASARVLLNAVQIDGATPGQPVILEVAPSVFNNIIGIMQEWGDILDVANGRDLSIERVGKGVNTKYTVQVTPKATPLPSDIMSKVTNLDEYVAQENETARIRAITSVNSVVGLLTSPAPSSGDVPRIAPAMSALDIEQEAALEGLMSSDPTPTKVVESDPVDEPSAVDVAKTAATVATATAAATSSSSADEDDLDALLKELGS